MMPFDGKNDLAYVLCSRSCRSPFAIRAGTAWRPGRRSCSARTGRSWACSRCCSRSRSRGRSRPSGTQGPAFDAPSHSRCAGTSPIWCRPQAFAGRQREKSEPLQRRNIHLRSHPKIHQLRIKISIKTALNCSRIVGMANNSRYGSRVSFEKNIKSRFNYMTIYTR